MKQIILFLVVAILCGGCAVKKDKQIFEGEVRQSEWNRADSQRWERQLEVTGCRAMNVQRYKLSKPDSCGMQYVEYLVQADIKEHTDTKEMITGQIRNVQHRQEQTERYRKEHTKSQATSTGWHYGLIGIAGFIICVIVIRRRVIRAGG